MWRRELYAERRNGGRELHCNDLDEDLTGTWTLDGRLVRFSQGADTFIRDAVFTAGPNTLSSQGTFGDTSLRLVLTRTANRVGEG